MIQFHKQSDGLSCSRRDRWRISSMCDLRAWAPVLRQQHRVQRRLAWSQRWHHQLWQLPVCHADGVSVHHHGGLDRRAVLGEPLALAAVLMAHFDTLWLTHAFSFNVSSNQTHSSNVADNVVTKLLIISSGSSYVYDWLCKWLFAFINS